MSEYARYINKATDSIHERLKSPQKGFSRNLDEVEILIKDDPKAMAKMHFEEGYYREKNNPYERLSGNYNAYENAFLSMTLRSEHE